jgi:uncharacterized protein YjbI with pentapeptide repeats
MANQEQLEILEQGVSAWNTWRKANPTLRGVKLSRVNLYGAYLSQADLSEASLMEADLGEANLTGANLSQADLSWAKLTRANLSRADLSRAKLTRADFSQADLSRADLTKADLSEAKLTEVSLSGANLSGANLSEANLFWAHLPGADLSGASLYQADLSGADLSGANLSRANLSGANLRGADLYGADLRGASIQRASLVETNLAEADLTGCRIYGMSAWDLKLEGAKQDNLIITPKGQAEITVDNIEVAQFVYLLLHNGKIRDVIDTITSKAVLILGRFTPERKRVLDALRDELRQHGYLPILFDFEGPKNRDITETISLLARMARFIIADLTDPSSIPKELEAIVPSLAVPVQPLLEGLARPYSMFKDYWKYDWVLPPYRYEGLEPLLTALADKVIAPAEAKVKALEERRRAIETELTGPRAAG